MTECVSVANVGGVSCVKVELSGSFDIEKTFDCGQCFRFDRVKDSSHKVEFGGVAFGRAVSFASDGNELYIYNSTEEEYFEIWRNFLSLDMDYAAIDEDLLSRCPSEAFLNAVECGRGIRILRQDPYELIISFIISQNNNIPRIKQIIERLSQWVGKKIDLPEEMERHMPRSGEFYSFPTAEALNSLGVDGLFSAKTGFRAKYIYDATAKILDGKIVPSRIFEFDGLECGVEYLSSIKGVGPKVASCILLFSGARFDAFPVDVWIKKVMEKYFPDGSFTKDSFGAYAGIAQQYLFYYERYLGGMKE